MSFFDCMQEIINDPEQAKFKDRAERAQKMWRELSDQYENQGHPRHIAEGLAGEDTKLAFRKEAGDERHVFLAKVANMRQLQQNVSASADLRWHQTRSVEELDYKARGLVRRFNGRLKQFLKEHHRDLLGRVTKPAQMQNIIRELHGEATGDAAALALSKAIRDTLEDMRLMFNEAGGIMGKLENYGLPHSHNRRAISKAGFERWFRDTQPKINWRQIENHATGRPFQLDGGAPPSMAIQRRFLKDVFDNIAFGKGSKEATYGATQGSALYRRRSESRVLHFNSADDWIAYNKAYGSGDPYKSLMGHVHKMARDIAAMRAFGPNPNLGLDYQRQLVIKQTRKMGDVPLHEAAVGNGNHARRMLHVEMGGVGSETLRQEFWSTFLSSTRHVMTAAMLDRAVIASISDTNTMRLAAQAVGMNPANLISRHVDLMRSQMSLDDALRGQWVADTLADPGIAMARFQAEVPPAEFAERLSNASMRVQGLSHWTDTGRIAFQMEMSGLMASNAGRRLSEVDESLQSLLKEWGVSEADWDAFRDPSTLFTAANGATFASPMYWREATSLDPRRANEIFEKIQGLIEEQTEYAVPTQSLLARGAIDPAAFDMPPGSIPYEVIKSGTMFKSFAMTFTVNQVRRIAAQPTWQAKALYGMNLVAGATVMGSLALQLGEIVKGNDPQPMTEPMFWARAAMKGGGFGVIGDIVSAGSSSWGGGFGSYVSGPMPQLLGDVWGLTVWNGIQFASGSDTNFASEVSRFGKRYTPMGQTPVLGPTIDRLFWDQLQLFLDPESRRAIDKAATRRQNLYGNASWWMPGSPAPHRPPSLETVFRR